MILTGGGRGNRPGDGIGFAMSLIMITAYFLSGIPQKLYALADPPAGMFIAWVPMMIASFLLTKLVAEPIYKKFAAAVGEQKAKKIDFVTGIIFAVLMFVLFFLAVRKGNPFTTTYLF